MEYHGISPFSIGKSSSKGPFPIAMLVFRGVSPKTDSLEKVALFQYDPFLGIYVKKLLWRVCMGLVVCQVISELFCRSPFVVIQVDQSWLCKVYLG